MNRRTAARLRQLQVRWRLAALPLRLIVQAALATAVGLAGYAALQANEQINETAASILVAVLFGTVAVFQQRQTQRRQHTVDLLTAFQSADRLAAADEWMSGRITRRAPVGPDVPAADEGHVITMLDYYEFLAVLAQRGLVDVPLVVDLRGSAMTRAYRICESYIADRRARVWPGLYVCLELFAVANARRTGADQTPAEPPEPPAAGPPPADAETAPSTGRCAPGQRAGEG